MVLELDVDDATMDRIVELDQKTEGNVQMQITFAVEDLVQEKYQELRVAESQQAAQAAPEVDEDDTEE